MSTESQHCQSIQSNNTRASITSRDSPMKAHQRSRSSSKGRIKNAIVSDEFQIRKRPPRRRQETKEFSLIQSPVPKNKKKKLVQKKKSTIVAETVKRKIEDLNKRLDQLEETTDEESVTSHYEISDMDSHSITSGQNKSLQMLYKNGSNLNVNKANKNLKAMIVTEEEKSLAECCF